MINLLASIRYLSLIEGDIKGRVTMGYKCQTWKNSLIDAQNGFVKLGSHCSVNRNSILFGEGGLTIGDYVRIAQNVLIYSSTHNFKRTDVPISQQGYIKRPTIIKDDVWIGAGVIILAGSKIGKGCVIGAGCLINGTIQDYSIVIGERSLYVSGRHGGRK